MQYADTIDEAVEILKKDNNGLYTNEWLLADINTNEIAMFELGTHKSKLLPQQQERMVRRHRRLLLGLQQHQGPGGAAGDRSPASKAGRPTSSFTPSDRDTTWLQALRAAQGQDRRRLRQAAPSRRRRWPPIPRSTPSSPPRDMAKELKTCALFGPPLGRTWEPTIEERKKYPEIQPLVSNPWTILHAAAAGRRQAKTVRSPSICTIPNTGEPLAEAARCTSCTPPNVPAWHGTLLPASRRRHLAGGGVRRL